jgi:O-antigen ligase
MNRRLERVILSGLIGVVIFTALAHGAVETWSLAIFELVIILLTALWGIRAVISKHITLRVPRVALPLVLLLVWGLIQSIVYTDQAGQRHSLSMDVEATRQTTTILFILLLALLLVASILAHREYLAKLPMFLTAYGFVLALFGLIQYFAWDGRFFWWRQTTDIVTSPFGPFVAHNHFAGYMELLLPIPIAFVIMQIGRVETRIFYGFAATFMGAAAVASLSRGGFISLFAQLIFLAVVAPLIPRQSSHSGRDSDRHGVLTKHSPRRKSGKFATPLMAVIAITIAIGASVYWIGLEPVVNRVAQGKIVTTDAKEESFMVSRGWIWRDTLTMIRAHFGTGIGLGAFETAFPIYSQSDGSLQIGQAHNDYLQLVAEAGILGVILLLWFLGIVISQTFRGMQSSDPLMAALALGSGGSIVGMMVHSIFDFNLQLPSHALLLVFLTAVLARVNVPEVSLAVVPVIEGISEKALVNTVNL